VERLERYGDATLAFGGLLCDLGPQVIGSIVRRWGGSNDLKATLQHLAKHADDWQRAADMELCEFKRLIASTSWERLTRLWAAREVLVTGETLQTEQAVARATAIDPGQVSPDPLVTGADLMGMGLCEGKRLGQVLRKVYDAQLNETVASRAEAMEMARGMIDTHPD
jgi:hypothetical protein